MVSSITCLKWWAALLIPASLRLWCLPRATDFAWQRPIGKAARALAATPKGHRSAPDWRSAVVVCMRQRPATDYGGAVLMMLGAGVAAVLSSSVYRGLHNAGSTTCWTQTPSNADRKYLCQPHRIHGQQHTTSACPNIVRANCLFASVLGGYWRPVLHHEVCLDLTTPNVETVAQRALAHLPPATPTPGLISGNGLQGVSR